MLTTWPVITQKKSAHHQLHALRGPSDTCLHHAYCREMQPISTMLTPILIASTSSVIFPDAWKHATILTLLKKPSTDPSTLANYRPIFLLPFPAKILEKITNRHLTEYLNDLQLFDPTQSGFRPHYNMETALIAPMDDIRRTGKRRHSCPHPPRPLCSI